MGVGIKSRGKCSENYSSVSEKRKKYISANDYFYLILRPNFQSKVIMNIKKVLEKVIESCDIL